MRNFKRFILTLTAVGVVSMVSGLATSAAKAQERAVDADNAGLMAANEDPLMVMAGDGLRFVALESEGDGGSMRGELRSGATAYPFRAKFDEAGENLSGSVTVAGKSINFRATQDLDTGNMQLSIGAKTYRLKPVDADSPDIAGRAADLGDGAPAANAPAANTPAVQDIPPIAPVPPADRPAVPAADKRADEPANFPAAAPGAALPDQMKLKKVNFPDISMGNVVALSMLVPEGWKSEGAVEWRGTPTPYAQRNIRLQSPDGYEMEFPLDANFNYIEYSQQALERARQLGMAVPEQRQGVPPPRDGGEWIAGLIAQRQGVLNVRIVSAQRDRRAEQTFADTITRAGGQFNMDAQSWVVRATYDQHGKAMEEEVMFLLQIYPPMQDQEFTSGLWGSTFDVAWRAPRERFDAMRPAFQMIHRSVRADPQWFTQSMEVRTQLLRQQTFNMIEELKRRAGEYNRQLTQGEMAAYKSKTASDDEAQRLRINSIAETHDYADKDGTRVNVPIHYKSVFGDGNGNYVLTNNSYQPGGEFTELKQWR